jgi:hypothetical protein
MGSASMQSLSGPLTIIGLWFGWIPIYACPGWEYIHTQGLWEGLWLDAVRHGICNLCSVHGTVLVLVSSMDIQFWVQRLPSGTGLSSNWELVILLEDSTNFLKMFQVGSFWSPYSLGICGTSFHRKYTDCHCTDCTWHIQTHDGRFWGIFCSSSWPGGHNQIYNWDLSASVDISSWWTQTCQSSCKSLCRVLYLVLY